MAAAKHRSAALLLSLSISAASMPLNTPLVPMPLHSEWGVGQRYLPSTFHFESNVTGCPTLTKAFSRFEAIILKHQSMPGLRESQHESQQLESIRILLGSVDELPPQLATDESYVLQIPGTADGSTLECASVYGCLHGLQTFSQLVRFDFDVGKATVSGVPLSISDRPRFAHRGLMLDTARHFYPTSFLFSLLDAMSMVKMNLLHWHISDSTSFPLHVPGTKLSEGAYSPSSRYSTADVHAVVEAARMRAIRVVPEFDMPVGE
jgi:hexosaminidase